MKIAFVSDLHHEFNSQIDVLLTQDVDVLVLPGDIDKASNVVNRAHQIANGHARHIVFICGNHEFYGSRVDKAKQEINLSLLAYLGDMQGVGTPEFPDIYFLDDGAVTIDGFRFAGGTMWTDFGLFGNPHLAMIQARDSMNDYRRIKFKDRDTYRRFLPQDALDAHRKTKNFLWDEIGLAYDEGRLDKLVVITHHGPTHMSIDPEFIGNELNPCYAVDWGHRISYTGPKYWFHGHVHCEHDYMCGDTRVLCNPYGYPGQRPEAVIKYMEL